MISFLQGPVHGAIIGLLLVLNTLFWATWLYIAVLFKLVSFGRVRNAFSRLAAHFAQNWAMCNVFITDTFMRIEWDVRIHADLNPQGQYLCCANHQSWNDIFVLMGAFGRKAPFFKFFLKQELIWVPVLGLAWWGLDYPFMKRYTKAEITKNPKLAGTDLATTRKACEKYKDVPVLILNFLEGTRFTPAKHQRMASPYKHLLKPKSGGFAFAVSALGEKLNSLLDVTIVYPQGAIGFWPFLCGRMRKVVVEIKQLQVPHEFYVGSYETDPEFRARFHTWIAGLWAQKDKRIAELLRETA